MSLYDDDPGDVWWKIYYCLFSCLVSDELAWTDNEETGTGNCISKWCLIMDQNCPYDEENLWTNRAASGTMTWVLTGHTHTHTGYLPAVRRFKETQLYCHSSTNVLIQTHKPVFYPTEELWTLNEDHFWTFVNSLTSSCLLTNPAFTQQHHESFCVLLLAPWLNYNQYSPFFTFMGFTKSWGKYLPV